MSTHIPQARNNHKDAFSLTQSLVNRSMRKCFTINLQKWHETTKRIYSIISNMCYTETRLNFSDFLGFSRCYPKLSAYLSLPFERIIGLCFTELVTKSNDRKKCGTGTMVRILSEWTCRSFAPFVPPVFARFRRRTQSASTKICRSIR